MGVGVGVGVGAGASVIYPKSFDLQFQQQKK